MEIIFFNHTSCWYSIQQSPWWVYDVWWVLTVHYLNKNDHYHWTMVMGVSVRFIINTSECMHDCCKLEWYSTQRISVVGRHGLYLFFDVGSLWLHQFSFHSCYPSIVSSLYTCVLHHRWVKQFDPNFTLTPVNHAQASIHKLYVIHTGLWRTWHLWFPAEWEPTHCWFLVWVYLMLRGQGALTIPGKRSARNKAQKRLLV